MILIYSRPKEEHARHLRRVLQNLREKEHYAKFKKCEFWWKEVAFLLHRVTKEDIILGSLKILQILLGK